MTFTYKLFNRYHLFHLNLPKNYIKRYESIRFTSYSGDPVTKIPDTCKIDKQIICDDNNVLWRPRKFTIHTLPFYYMSASKFRLTSMVVLTTIAGCIVTPLPTDPFITLIMGISSFLVSSASHSINQLMEYPHDSQMERTKNRLLPLALISTPHILALSIICGIIGTSLLAMYVNSLTCALAIINFILYTACYTPMKQFSMYNTWIGSIVGAIPPLAGYTAITNCIDINSIFLAMILFCWQFPHFNSLSWLLRDSYTRCGIKMMSNNNVTLMKNVTMRYSIALTLVCLSLPYCCDHISSWFAVSSLVQNIPAMYYSKKFVNDLSYKNTLNLFRISLLQLLMLMLLLIIHKKQPSNVTVDDSIPVE